MIRLYSPYKMPFGTNNPPSPHAALKAVMAKQAEQFRAQLGSGASPEALQQASEDLLETAQTLVTYQQLRAQDPDQE
jgi:hypothetical protein